MRLAALCIAVVLSAPALGAGDSISLATAHFVPIHFDGIPTTAYANEDGALVMTVNASSSFLLLPFKQQRSVGSVSFLWRTTGKLKVKSAAQEAQKDGDDYRLRIGLIKAGKPPMVPMFAPVWIIAIRDHMKLGANEIDYIVVGAHHKAGSSWESPYSASMRLLAAPSVKAKDNDWQTATLDLKPARKVVGLWIMADGDNTGSHFETRLKDLVLAPRR